MNRQTVTRGVVALLGLTGLVFVLFGGGYEYSGGTSGWSVTLFPGTVIAWPFFACALILALQAKPVEPSRSAAWWRRFGSLFVDWLTVLTITSVPECLLALAFEHGTLPPPWSFSRSHSEPTDWILFAVAIVSFAACWVCAGFALHPRITSPGALIFGISIRTKSPVSNRRLAAVGLIAYFSTAIPWFGSKQSGIEVQVGMRDA